VRIVIIRIPEYQFSHFCSYSKTKVNNSQNTEIKGKYMINILKVIPVESFTQQRALSDDLP
jgi:hypothetical protein